MYEKDGVLIDISESGACVRVPSAQLPDTLLAFVVRWDEENILLRGRVVRSRVQRPRPDAVPIRIEHLVGLEFYQLPPHSVDQLHRLTASAQ